MFAARNGHTATCEALLARGADVEAKHNVWRFRGRLPSRETLSLVVRTAGPRLSEGGTLMYAALRGHTAIKG